MIDYLIYGTLFGFIVLRWKYKYLYKSQKLYYAYIEANKVMAISQTIM